MDDGKQTVIVDRIVEYGLEITPFVGAPGAASVSAAVDFNHIGEVDGCDRKKWRPMIDHFSVAVEQPNALLPIEEITFEVIFYPKINEPESEYDSFFSRGRRVVLKNELTEGGASTFINVSGPMVVPMLARTNGGRFMSWFARAGGPIDPDNFQFATIQLSYHYERLSSR